jgi:hypothetical protein
LNDPRANAIYRAPRNGGALKGTDYGANANAANCSNCTSGIGTGIGKSFTMPMWIMTSVEAQFLVAEATIRGWISGDAQAAYSLAVTESFKWLFGAASGASAATTYLAQGNTRITRPATGPLQEKLAVKAWQKYIGLKGIGMLESWNDVRRLGVVVQPTTFRRSATSIRACDHVHLRLLSRKYGLGGVRECGAWRPD